LEEDEDNFKKNLIESFKKGFKTSKINLLMRIKNNVYIPINRTIFRWMRAQGGQGRIERKEGKIFLARLPPKSSANDLLHEKIE
jgi:hypothetical protein